MALGGPTLSLLLCAHRFFRSSWGLTAQPGVLIHGHVTPECWGWRECLAHWAGLRPLSLGNVLEGPCLLDNGTSPWLLSGLQLRCFCEAKPMLLFVNVFLSRLFRFYL